MVMRIRYVIAMKEVEVTQYAILMENTLTFGKYVGCPML